jgi:hypothetical protein
MPVVINEIEVMDKPSAAAPSAPPAPASGPAQDLGDTVRLVLRDLAERQRRLVAD